MKRRVEAASHGEMKTRFPLSELLDGWYFRVTETSAGVYLAEGSDPWGRSVSRHGTDADVLLARCLEDARDLGVTPSGVGTGGDEPARFSVWRLDDNGNEALVVDGLTHAEAEETAATFQARGHKQLYTVRPDRSAP